MSAAPLKNLERLIGAATRARARAYCPYSRYPVGAAVLTKSGRVFAAGNVENASYGLAMCAERGAVHAAVAAGHAALAAVCIVGAAAKPCGACRQVLREFSDAATTVHLVDPDAADRRRALIRTTVFKLLPLAFDPLASGLLPRKRRK